MKKTLLALTTAAAVAVAGAPAAFAQTTDTKPNTESSTLDSVKAELSKDGDSKGSSLDSVKAELSKDGDNEGSSDLKAELSSKNEGGLTGSLNGFFGWHGEGATDKDGKPVAPTTGLQKLKDIGALLAAIIAVVTGVSGLVGAFEKLAK